VAADTVVARIDMICQGGELTLNATAVASGTKKVIDFRVYLQPYWDVNCRDGAGLEIVFQRASSGKDSCGYASVLPERCVYGLFYNAVLRVEDNDHRIYRKWANGCCKCGFFPTPHWEFKDWFGGEGVDVTSPKLLAQPATWGRIKALYRSSDDQ